MQTFTFQKINHHGFLSMDLSIGTSPTQYQGRGVVKEGALMIGYLLSRQNRKNAADWATRSELLPIIKYRKLIQS